METTRKARMTPTIGSPLSGTTWMARRGPAGAGGGGTPPAVITASDGRPLSPRSNRGAYSHASGWFDSGTVVRMPRREGMRVRNLVVGQVAEWLVGRPG